MLGYFASTRGYGMAYYEALKSNGAKQVNSPDNVLTGVAQGTYRAGFALANAAYAAQKKGSPIEIVWPAPGAIAIYAPIGLTAKKKPSALAEDFAAFVASRAGQKPWPPRPARTCPPRDCPGHRSPPAAGSSRPTGRSCSAPPRPCSAGYTKIFGS